MAAAFTKDRPTSAMRNFLRLQSLGNGENKITNLLRTCRQNLMKFAGFVKVAFGNFVVNL